MTLASTPRAQEAATDALHLARFGADLVLKTPNDHTFTLAFRARVLPNVLVLEPEIVLGCRDCSDVHFRSWELKACEVKPAVVPGQKVGTGISLTKLFELVVEKTSEQVAEGRPLAHQRKYFGGGGFHSSLLAFIR